MATVRLQRRIHRPPRHRLRAAGNGRGTRGDALPGPRPKRHRVPGPRDATSLARPPARPERGSPPPPRAPAWHLTQVAPPKFPREGPRDKSPSQNSPELRGARPARPLRPQPPRAPVGPARAHAALCFLSSPVLPTCSIRMSDCFPGPDT